MIPILEMSSRRPSVYLDQWVWIRLAKARVGRPKDPVDADALDAVRRASAAGVRFPLSTTHYQETLTLNQPRQRRDIADVMAPISNCCTIRARPALLRHQILAAMHEVFGRPAFRPAPPAVFGTGVRWAFTGKEGWLRIYDSNGEIPLARRSGPDRLRLRRANQWAEYASLAGPDASEIEALRNRYGYRPEEARTSLASRVAWEADYKNLLANSDAITAAELRVRLFARELIHEELPLLNRLLAEYHVNLLRSIGFDPARPESGRGKMVQLTELIPTLRISAEMKLELFRNADRKWKPNMLHDIDAISTVVPYCDLVIADKDAVDMIKRSGAHERYGCQVIASLHDLVAELPALEQRALHHGDSTTGWESIAPGSGFCTEPPSEAFTSLRSA